MISDQPHDQPQFNILVVDDTPDSLRLLVGILSDQGYKVRAAPNGRLALAAAQALPPDLILLDINMPEMDGYEVCRRFKADERTSAIPIIFLSAWSDVFDKVKAFSVGGVDYITKPFQIEEAVVRIKTHLTICALQNTLKQKNHDLTETLHQLKSTQAQLIQAEKMAALGQLIANVAHEINTPLGAIRSSAKNIHGVLHQTLEQLPQVLEAIPPHHWQLFLRLLQRARLGMAKFPSLSSREKRQLRRSLVQQLAVHDIPHCEHVADTLVDMAIYDDLDPLLPLLYDQTSQRVLNAAYQLASLHKSAHTILTASDRAARIVLALTRYIHHDASGLKTETDVVESIETALALYYDQCRQRVEIIRNYHPVPLIWAFPDELNQVWSNLLHNALQAMEYKGQISITVQQPDPEQICVAITDSGKGIPPELQSRIFEPFFTTKPKGEGSGLGLSIVNQIIEKHAGHIEVASVPGRTTFTVFLPIQSVSAFNE
ncbi:MAG: response regulator [Synechococcales cyanobacterium C42_A2020_086]|jgi:signal transduction histidine kinase|nr:response regulator [Synechococcales cyanobacterium M58_A2018_015]MBF2074215.1 response regulator [Synechococcales cyanobacterium C42_A2020_086]